jgi:N-acetyl-gamma-glutamyl-phosphate/LysW-gamma-L-alpha-aminoadipyl-6-phosphate reductase
MVRGILSTCHTFTKREVALAEIWKAYRSTYPNEPFIRFVRDRKGLYRYPDPKIVVGSNFCDIGFEIDERNGRIVVLSATDNLLKGAAGIAVQSMNVMMGFDETLGLRSAAIHPA